MCCNVLSLGKMRRRWFSKFCARYCLRKACFSKEKIIFSYTYKEYMWCISYIYLVLDVYACLTYFHIWNPYFLICMYYIIYVYMYACALYVCIYICCVCCIYELYICYIWRYKRFPSKAMGFDFKTICIYMYIYLL